MTLNQVDWLARWLTLALVTALLYLYWRGGRVREPDRPVSGRAHLYFLSALGLILAVFWTPLHSLAVHLFGLHVLQHLLLSALIPALFWIANPLPRLFAGLPAGSRMRVKAVFAPERRPRRWLQAVTNRGAVWLGFVACAWFWYDPLVHAAVRRSPWLHALEALTMLVTAGLYWWHIAGAAPRLHPPLPRWVQTLYTYAGSGPIKLIGAAFLFASSPFYDYTTAELARWGLTPEMNQMLGGILIWTFGGVAYTIAAGMFLRHLMQQEAEKPPLPIESWSNERNMLAPGA